MLLHLVAEILTRVGARLKRAGARLEWARAQTDDADYFSNNLVAITGWSSDMGHRTNEVICVLRRRKAGRRCSGKRTQVFLVLLLLEQVDILLH